MAQHLLVAMIGPIALVLGAPVTLLLRALPQGQAARLGRLLRSRSVHALTRPALALALSSGGLVVLYFTPLYALSGANEPVHALVHLHLLVWGSVFAWVVAGPDPAPDRPGVRARLLLLGTSIAVHASALRPPRRGR